MPGLPDRAARRAPTSSPRSAQRDILLHHPYQSFEPVVDFIRRPRDDPDVVAIKQTVYRTGVDSVLMEALIEAARRGKEVTVVVELMARFDEEANINWAERLEQAGAQVVYGVFGLKTHAKLALLMRRERDARRTRCAATRTSAPATTTRAPRGMYTDFGLLTADPPSAPTSTKSSCTSPASRKPSQLKRLLLAPFTLQRRADRGDPQRGRAIARHGKPARIIAKMNGLLEEARDPRAVRRLAGRRRDRPDRARRVRAAARRARAVRQHPGALDRRPLPRAPAHLVFRRTTATHDVYLSSADWMGRNLFRRIEVAFPVLDPALKAARHRRRTRGLSRGQLQRRVGCSAPTANMCAPSRGGRRDRACVRAGTAARSAGRTSEHHAERAADASWT